MIATSRSLPTPGDVVAAARLADLAATAALLDRPLPPVPRARRRGAPQTLHITYLLSRIELGGGAGVLIEQADQLAALGTKVTVVSRFPAPTWFPLRLRYLQVPFGEPIVDATPPCDLIVAGHWEFVLPARQLAMAPVAYLEQGEFHLYDALPEQLRGLVAASVAGAQTACAVGGAAARALKDRYGVDAVTLSSAVDTSVFSPAVASPSRLSQRSRPSSSSNPASPSTPVPPSRSVLVIGWDGPRTWAIEDARAIVSALAESHPEVRPVLVTGVDPAVDLTVAAEIVVSPSRQELLARYRAATVCVSCSRDLASPLAPLKAMAVGTPVVTTATDGALADCEHERDALIVPIGDVAGLVAAVRRLLDDHQLAARLSVAGRRTALAHSWTDAAGQVLECYRAAAGATGAAGAGAVGPGAAGAGAVGPGDRGFGAFALDLAGVFFDDPAHEQRLRSRLESCPTRSLAIPIAQPVLPGHELFRWRTVAWRPEGVAGTTRAYLPARAATPVRDSPYQQGIDDLCAGRGEAALEFFAAECERADRSGQAVLGRWVVLALLAAGRPADAATVAAAFAHDHPAHPDYLYLGVRAARTAGQPVEVAGPLEALRLLGRGARFEEWFDAPAALLRAYLG